MSDTKVTNDLYDRILDKVEQQRTPLGGCLVTYRHLSVEALDCIDHFQQQRADASFTNPYFLGKLDGAKEMFERMVLNERARIDAPNDVKDGDS